MSKTPLEKLQDELGAKFPMRDEVSRRLCRETLDAFLVKAYDMGVQAHRELTEAGALSDQENFRRKTARGRLDDPNYRARGDR